VNHPAEQLGIGMYFSNSSHIETHGNFYTIGAGIQNVDVKITSNCDEIIVHTPEDIVAQNDSSTCAIITAKKLMQLLSLLE
jgi:homoaconitase/3-isopropylmalate dehydratase large subunit